MSGDNHGRSKHARSSFYDFDLLRQHLPLPHLLEKLELGMHAKRSALCPFHGDRHSSFSVFKGEKGWRWKCHAGCGGGTEIGFLMQLAGCSKEEAVQRWGELAGAAPISPLAYPIKRPRAKREQQSKTLKLPPDLHTGTQSELETLAALRKVNIRALERMQTDGVLKFGTVLGLPCWIVTDVTAITAEARRMDGHLFPRRGNSDVHKVHTLTGSSKKWPVGLGASKSIANILLLEGSGDLVAGYHFALDNEQNWLPVAILGSEIRGIHPHALEILRGKRVKIVPHCDPSNKGSAAGEAWAAELQQIGCTVTWFSLDGLRWRDASPIKDLNDCTDIHPEDLHHLRGLLA
jgi:hypothetical protein